MLILVVVTVTLANEKGGLFEKAREAAKGTEMAKEKEELTVAITTAHDAKTGVINKEKLKNALGTEWTVDGEEGGPYTVTSPKGNIYNVATNGTIAEKNKTSGTTLADMYCDKENCTDETHLHKGDYVNYTPTTAQAYAPDKGEGIGKYTGYTEGESEQSIPQESLNWRVLGKDTNGNILLISGAPTGATLTFYGYVGYNNYEDVLNDTCNALYSNTGLGATARSITMDDIDTYLGGSNYDKTTYGGGSSSIRGYGYQNENVRSSSFKYNKETNTLKKEDCTIPAKDLISNAYAYDVTSDLIGEKNREILFGKGEKQYYNFVASRMINVGDPIEWCIAYAGEDYISADTKLCASMSSLPETDDVDYLRPIIMIPSSITTNDINKKNEPVIETWNDPLDLGG